MPDLTVYQVVFRHDDLFELQLERGDILFEPGTGRAGVVLLAARRAEGTSSSLPVFCRQASLFAVDDRIRCAPLLPVIPARM
ncbi:MAG: hypothetical protein R6W66_10300 [Pelovirga sp.]